MQTAVLHLNQNKVIFKVSNNCIKTVIFMNYDDLTWIIEAFNHNKYSSWSFCIFLAEKLDLNGSMLSR